MTDKEDTILDIIDELHEGGYHGIANRLEKAYNHELGQAHCGIPYTVADVLESARNDVEAGNFGQYGPMISVIANRIETAHQWEVKEAATANAVLPAVGTSKKSIFGVLKAIAEIAAMKDSLCDFKEPLDGDSSAIYENARTEEGRFLGKEIPAWWGVIWRNKLKEAVRLAEESLAEYDKYGGKPQMEEPPKNNGIYGRGATEEEVQNRYPEIKWCQWCVTEGCKAAGHDCLVICDKFTNGDPAHVEKKENEDD